DTPTWLAHDGETFERVGRVLLPGAAAFDARRVLVPVDAWAQADALFQPALQRVREALCELLAVPAQPLTVSEEGLDAWRQVYVTSGAYEGWQAHGAWIAGNDPGFAPPIAQRWQAASAVPAEAAAEAAAHAARVRSHVRELLGDD